MDPLTFEPQPMQRWLDVLLLLRSASEVVVSGWFGKFADKRESQDWPQDVFRHQDGDSVWLDFASDTGDGFDSTFSIASLLAREQIDLEELDGMPLPRGEALVFGGDEVYPAASPKNYVNHFLGPFVAALPFAKNEASAPKIYATPGNHDWYDGLTSFLRLFAQERWIGGWKTRQKRSYFAIKLPGPWWLWAVDIQFDTEIDPTQARYFEWVAEHDDFDKHSKVILVTAKPSWVDAERNPQSYNNLAVVERKIVPKDVDLVATMTGDLHHYARYETIDSVAKNVPRLRITCGGAGAYLSDTATLPRELKLEQRPWQPDSDSDRYQRKKVYPEPEDSRRLAKKGILAPLKTRSFAILTAGVYGLVATYMLAGLSGDDMDLGSFSCSWLNTAGKAVGSNGFEWQTVVVWALLIGGLIGFADFKPRWKRVVVGLAHGLVHIAIVTTVVWAAIELLLEPHGGNSVWIAGILGSLLAGAVLGSLVVGIYLFAAYSISGANAPAHTNHLFAAQGLDTRKSFMRVKFNADGTATAYAIGLDRPCRDWKLTAGEGAPAAVEPDGPGPEPHLIETFDL